MKLIDLEAFRNKVRLCYEKYESDLQRLEIDWARKERLPPEEIQGQARQRIVEAQVRAYVLDPVLQALGWRVDSAIRMVVEDAAEPNNLKDNRRFLDYHGRNQRDDTKADSLLIIEAKRSTVALPVADLSLVSLAVAEALGQIHASKSVTSVAKDWAERLETLVDYAKRVKQEVGRAPKVVAITNGDWFIVFENAEEALLAKAPSAVAIAVYADSSAVLQDAERFWKSLSYESLSEYVPPQVPASLQHFVTGPTEKIEAVLAVDVSYTSHGEHPDQQPSIAAQVFALLRVAGEGWITFRHDHPDKYIELHHDGERRDASLRDLRERVEALLADLRRHADITLLSTSEAEEILKKQGWSAPHLCKSKEGKHYRLVTGKAPFFVLEENTWDGCPYHDFGPCTKEGKPNPHGPIYGRSLDPRVFFPSGSPMHCAHSEVHEARRKVGCVIAGFEQLLCCRRCAFFSRCYPNEKANALPCRQK